MSAEENAPAPAKLAPASERALYLGGAAGGAYLAACAVPQAAEATYTAAMHGRLAAAATVVGLVAALQYLRDALPRPWRALLAVPVSVACGAAHALAAGADPLAGAVQQGALRGLLAALAVLADD